MIPPEHLTTVRNQLKTISNGQMEQLRNELNSNPEQKRLFLKCIIEPADDKSWTKRLQSEPEQKKEQEIKQSVELEKTQTLLFQQQLQQKQMADTKKVKEELELKQAQDLRAALAAQEAAERARHNGFTRAQVIAAANACGF